MPKSPLQTLPSPSLILVMGVPGTGKTTLAKRLVMRLHTVYLDNNFIADGFFPETRVSEEYRRLRPGMYRVLYRIAHENLALGNSVLLDVPHVTHMQDSEWRDRVQADARRFNAHLIILRCRCSEATLRARITSRAEERDEWKLSNWEEFTVREPLDVHIPLEHLDIDTDGPIEESVEEALRYIKSAAMDG